MSEVLEEEAVLERVVGILSERRPDLSAALTNTGGGIYCIIIPVQHDRYTCWGTSDGIWGYDLNESDGEYITSGSTGVAATYATVPEAVEAILKTVEHLPEMGDSDSR